MSFEKKIQTVDTMIRSRASRKRHFLKDNSRMRAEKEISVGRGGSKARTPDIYIYIIFAKKLDESRLGLCRRPRYLKQKPFLVCRHVAASFSVSISTCGMTLDTNFPTKRDNKSKPLKENKDFDLVQIKTSTLFSFRQRIKTCVRGPYLFKKKVTSKEKVG